MNWYEARQISVLPIKVRAVKPGGEKLETEQGHVMADPEIHFIVMDADGLEHVIEQQIFDRTHSMPLEDHHRLIREVGEE